MTQVWRWSNVNNGWVETYDGILLYDFIVMALRDCWTMEGGDDYDDTWFIVP